MHSLLKSNVFLALIVIVLVGAFFRLYHFSDWMHYELDQARDFRITLAAIEYGPGELPLQGPRAAGSFLRLGPLFYYMEYASALVFGATPVGAAMVVPILSILSIPLFYLFSRRFFSRGTSLSITALFATSHFLIVYGRFPWNPNVLPFFSLLFGYAMLRAVEKSETRSGWWLALAAAALAFTTQMHFLALVAAPIIGAAFLLYARPKLRWTFWMGALGVFLFFQIPLLVNDIKTGGENAQEFWEVSTGRSEAENHTRMQQLFRNAGMHVEYFWILTTGHQKAELPVLDVDAIGYNIKCDYDCRQGYVFGALSAAALLVCVAAYGYQWRKVRACSKSFQNDRKNKSVDQNSRISAARPTEPSGRANSENIVKISRYSSSIFKIFARNSEIYGSTKDSEQALRENEKKRHFLVFVGLWAGTVFLLYTPIAYDIAPRFFLITSPVVFLLLGFFLESARGKKLWRGAGYALIGVLVVSNIAFTLKYFDELERARADTALTIGRDAILKEKTRVTLQQMQEIVDVIEERYQENGYTVFMHGQAEYKRAFWQLIEWRTIPRDHIPQDFDTIYAQANYFVVIRTQSDQEAYLEKYRDAFTIEEVREFGTMTLYFLKQKPEAITAQKKVFEPKSRDPKFSPGVQVRYLWRQVFHNEA